MDGTDFCQNECQDEGEKSAPIMTMSIMILRNRTENSSAVFSKVREFIALRSGNALESRCRQGAVRIGSVNKWS